MITVREAIEMIKDGAEEVTLACAGSWIDDFNWRNPITLKAYGDFLLDRIGALGENKFELNLALQTMTRETER